MFDSNRDSNRAAPWAEGKPEERITIPDAHGRFFDWEPELKPLVTLGTDGDPLAVESHVAVVRSDNNRPIGVVGKDYWTISNQLIRDNAVRIAGEGPVVETAGTFQGGGRVWYLLSTGSAFKVGADRSPVEPYLLFSSSHNGTGGYVGKYTATRVVCQNTLDMALRGGAFFKVHHTINGEINAEEAGRIMAMAVKETEMFKAWANEIVKVAWSGKQMEALAAKLLPAKDEGDVPTITQNNRDRMIELFETGDDHDASIAGSAWAAINAVTQWCDHERRHRGREQRIQSVLMGPSAALKTRAARLVTEEALAAVPAGPAGRVA